MEKEDLGDGIFYFLKWTWKQTKKPNYHLSLWYQLNHSHQLNDLPFNFSGFPMSANPFSANPLQILTSPWLERLDF
jgi:hypothetical protein